MTKRRHPDPETPGFGDPLLDERPAAQLDLHGFTARDAERRVMDFLATCARLHAGKVVRIITGKGLGSAGRAVLGSVVERVLDGEGARFVAEWRRDPFGGGVRVRGWGRGADALSLARVFRPSHTVSVPMGEVPWWRWWWTDLTRTCGSGWRRSRNWTRCGSGAVGW